MGKKKILQKLDKNLNRGGQPGIFPNYPFNKVFWNKTVKGSKRKIK